MNTKIFPDETHLQPLWLYWKMVDKNPSLETLVDVPQSQRFKIPSLNATYIKDNSGRVIMQYHSRLAAPDLKKIVEEYIPNIKITEFPVNAPSETINGTSLSLSSKISF